MDVRQPRTWPSIRRLQHHGGNDGVTVQHILDRKVSARHSRPTVCSSSSSRSSHRGSGWTKALAGATRADEPLEASRRLPSWYPSSCSSQACVWPIRWSTARKARRVRFEAGLENVTRYEMGMPFSYGLNRTDRLSLTYLFS